MNGEITPYLCGGIFFNLILNARTKDTSIIDSYTNKNESNSEVYCLKRLMNIIDASTNGLSENTIKIHTSNFKSCTLNSSKWLNFSNSIFINNLKNKYSFQYTSMQDDMHKFCCDFKIVQNKEWICSAILELISLDKRIDNESVFIYGIDRTEIQKEDLISKKDFCLEDFLLSILYYTIINRPSTNPIDGEETYRLWFDGEKYSKKRFSSTIGSKYNELNITIWEVNESLETEDNNNILSSKTESTARNFNFEYYKDKTLKRYSFVHTLILRNRALPFNDFYICNILSEFSDYYLGASSSKYICDASIKKLSEYSNHIFIEGNGGLGKSMMMRHFFLDTLNSYDEDRLLPILINLRNFGKSYDYFLDFILYEIKDYLRDYESEKDSIIQLIEDGKIVLLLDGLDEVSNSYRNILVKLIGNFIALYENNFFVITSRPIYDFVLNLNFEHFNILPFNLDQAVSLIERLDFRPDYPELKEKFITELKEKYFNTHRDFAENPLLLTIMLMTYSEYANIPSRIYKFYRAAFDNLTIHHDANKGAFERPLKSVEQPEDLSRILENFCFLTYRDCLLSFTYENINRYLLSINNKLNTNIKVYDLIEDLTTNTSLMFKDSNTYEFIHRSFQEYFCALFISNLRDKDLHYAISVFEQSNNSSHSKSFDMLFDMVPNRVEEFIFIPFLEELFDLCDKSDNSYIAFLKKIYPYINYKTLDNECFVQNNGSSFILNFIINHYNLVIKSSPSLEKMNSFITSSGLYKDGKKYSDTIVATAYISENQSDTSYHKTLTFKLKTEEILNSTAYEELKNIIISNDFPLHMLYNNVKSILLKLKSNYKDKREPDWYNNISVPPL